MTLVTFIALVGIADAELQIGMGAARGVHALGWDVSFIMTRLGWSIPHKKCCKEVLGMPGVVRMALQDMYVVNNRSV